MEEAKVRKCEDSRSRLAVAKVVGTLAAETSANQGAPVEGLAAASTSR